MLDYLHLLLGVIHLEDIFIRWLLDIILLQFRCYILDLLLKVILPGEVGRNYGIQETMEVEVD
jgi:hypothetical protein